MRINELTIGSHVNVENEIGEVVEIINTEYTPYIKVKIPNYNRLCISVDHPDLEPIKITPQYLQDHGFKHNPPYSEFSNNKHGSYERESGDFWVLVTHLGNDDWEVYLNRKETHLGRCRYIKYLHHMETFLHIHGTEL